MAPPPPPPGRWASTSLIPAVASPTHAWSAWVPNQSGDIVRSIQFITYTFAGKPTISVLRLFTFTGAWNGWGNPDIAGDDHTLNLALGEKITSCTIWYHTSQYTYVGRVKLVTDRGQTLDTAPDDTTLGAGFSRPVGGGLLCGAYLAYMGDIGINGLCLLYLAPTVLSVSATIKSITPDPVGTAANITPLALDVVHYKNVPNWTFGGSESRSTTNSWTSISTTAYKASASIEISGEFLGIGAKTTEGFEWTKTSEKSTEQSVTESEELTWSSSGTLGPNAGVTCSALVSQGLVDVSFTAAVVLKLSDGTLSSFTETGTYHNVSYGAVEVVAVPDPVTT